MKTSEKLPHLHASTGNKRTEPQNKCSHPPELNRIESGKTSTSSQNVATTCSCDANPCMPAAPTNETEETDYTPLIIKEMPAELRLFWEERVGIRQFDGGLSRNLAEIVALQDLLDLYPDALKP